MAALCLTLFPKDTNTVDAPYVSEFKNVLEHIAEDYGSRLMRFSIDHGKVIFNFDNEQVLYDIVEDIRDVVGLCPVIQR